jgi:hypothetical protein
MVTGAASPDMLKPVPDTAACEIVRTALPVLDSVSVWLVWVLIFTDPKETREGATAIEGFAAVEPTEVRAQPLSEKTEAEIAEIKKI